MKKNILVSTILLVTSLFLSACSTPGKLPSTNSSLNDASAKVKVVASFYPLAYFAEKIGGERVEVTTIVPPGTEPHEYEPTPQDIRRIQTASVIIYLGAGLDPWAEKMRVELEQKGIKVLQFSEGVALLSGHEEEGEHTQEEQDHDEFDPHIWLDPVLVREQVEKLAQAFIAADPQHRSVYEKNQKEFIGDLVKLEQSYDSGLAVCTHHTVITSHASAGYLAQRYNFDQHSISGFSPESEPSPRQIGNLATLAKEQGIKYIFFETLVSPKLAQTLADEAGAQTLVFNPIEGLTGDDTAQGKDYMSIMRENLQNLRLALDCK